MAVSLLRKESNVPTIQNSDDCRMLRYGVGGEDGVIKNFGSQCSHTASGNSFTINSGELCLGGCPLMPEIVFCDSKKRGAL